MQIRIEVDEEGFPVEPSAERIQRVLDAIQEARTWLTVRMPFFGFLCLRLRVRVAVFHDRVWTAGITPDGSLIVNVPFVEQLTPPQIRGLLAHEVMHPALEFWQRLNGRKTGLFNQAHDYAINQIIDEFARSKSEISRLFELPPGGLRDVRFDGQAAEEIYAALQAEENTNKNSADGEPVTGDGAGSLDGDCRSDLADTADGRAARRGDTAATRRLQDMWRNALEAAAQRHAQSGQGSLPGALQKLINDLKDPQITWQHALSNWIGENAGKPEFTYMRPSRRSDAAGAILPGARKMGFPEVTILWDTSGSMGPDETTAILTEVASIIEELGLSVRLMVCDADVHVDVEGLDHVDRVVALLTGGGGSDFCPAFTRLESERNNSVVIAFTDGYINVPGAQPECLKGVLWVLTEGGVRPAPWGMGLRMTAEKNAVPV